MFKKIFITLSCSSLVLLNTIGWAQESPTYDDNDVPIDLSVGEPKRIKPKTAQAPASTPPSPQTPPTPAPTVTTTPPTPPATAPAKAPEGLAPTEPTPLPATPTPAAPIPVPPPPPAPLPVPTPTTPPPAAISSAPVIPVLPATAPAEMDQGLTTPSALPPDGGPQKDAGSDLLTAFPITYAKYENMLSPQDSVDTYKFYARANEGIGVILAPAHPSTQFAVDLLGERGELLSQTQAPQAGVTLSFQTSPLDKNAIIYIQVKDSNLLPASPTDELRQYTLELKPIVAIQAEAPVATMTPEETPPAEQPQTPEPKKKSPTSGLDPMLLYGLIGVSVLAVALTVLIVLRRMKKKKGTTEE